MSHPDVAQGAPTRASETQAAPSQDAGTKVVPARSREAAEGVTRSALPRATRQRAAVLDGLDGADDFLGAQELHSRLRQAGQGVGLSTVYRTLQALAGAGEVDVLISPEGEARYRSCSTGHHHHLVCRRCNRTVEVRSAAVERWAATVAAEQGFSSVSHTIEVFGLCRDCAGQPA